MTENREKLRERIKALLAKTTANGCTEAEAMIAAAKAAELMKEFSLSVEELEVMDSFIPRTAKPTDRDRLWAVIAHVTNCAAIYTRDNDDSPIIKYYGVEPGPQIANYLQDICNRAIDTAISDFKKSDVYKRRRATSTRRQATKDFTHGMVNRLRMRIWDLFEHAINEQHQALAKHVRDTANPDSREMKAIKPHKKRFEDASNAGYRAGKDVSLNRGVGNHGKTLQIEG